MNRKNSDGAFKARGFTMDYKTCNVLCMLKVFYVAVDALIIKYYFGLKMRLQWLMQQKLKEIEFKCICLSATCTSIDKYGMGAYICIFMCV